jgi:hypothetical protein
MKSKIYLDVCALCRPYDDQTFLRIKLESTAVQLIIVHVKLGKFELYYSPVHILEIANNPDEIMRSDMITLLYNIAKNAKQSVKSDIIEKRGRSLIGAGFGAGDAFHIAHAEQLNACFISCDDQLLKKYRFQRKELWCGTPVEFCEKEGLF